MIAVADSKGAAPGWRSARDLAGWAIPPDILAQAEGETPWAFQPDHFRVGARTTTLETPSSSFEREVLPPGGSVLDVGCGGGRAGGSPSPRRQV